MMTVLDVHVCISALLFFCQYTIILPVALPVNGKCWK